MQQTTGWIQFSFNSTTRDILGGITRIRFKGFQTLYGNAMESQACGASRTFLFGIRLTLRSQRQAKLQAARYGRSKTWNVVMTSAVERFGNAVSRQAAISLLPALCWCEKWPSIFHSPVSTRFRHCRYQTYPCRRRCLRSSPLRRDDDIFFIGEHVIIADLE